MQSNENTDIEKTVNFQELINTICCESGIKLPDTMRTQAEYHLKKWLMERMIFSYEDYCKYLFEKEGTEEEVNHMVNVITTIIGFMQ